MTKNTLNIMSVFNQLAINQFLVPFELADIIKSFCFYDIKTARTISFIKTKKQQIEEHFKCGFSTRKTPLECYFANTEYQCEEHWAICLTLNSIDEQQFQASNCNKCGNYKISKTILSDKTSCSCVNELIQYYRIYYTNVNGQLDRVMQIMLDDFEALGYGSETDEDMPELVIDDADDADDDDSDLL